MEQEQRIALFKQLIESAKSMFEEFKSNPTIEVAEDADEQHYYHCNIFWILDKGRKSKIIRIKINKNALDFLNERQDQKENFNQFIHDKLNDFDPGHQNASEIEPPSEQWIFNFVYVSPRLTCEVLKDF